MACATLKRSLEFDPLHHSPSQRSPKRRRCMPMTLSPTAPPTKQHQTNSSPFSEVTPKLTNDQISARFALEIKRMQRRRQLPYPTSSSSPPPASCSPPPALAGAPDCMASPSQGFQHHHLHQQHTSMLGQSPPHTASYFNALSPSKKEAPLFTFKQVSLVCERMLKEREEQIRQEYDKVLTCKLAEQYEAFLKFNHDQLHRRFGESAASYVS